MQALSALANLLGLAYGVIWIACTWLMETRSEEFIRYDMPGALEASEASPLVKAALMHHFSFCGAAMTTMGIASLLALLVPLRQRLPTYGTILAFHLTLLWAHGRHFLPNKQTWAAKFFDPSYHWRLVQLHTALAGTFGALLLAVALSARGDAVLRARRKVKGS